VDPHSALYQRLQQIYVLLDDGDRRALKTVGLTPTHFTLLTFLDPAQREGRTVGRLAELMLCTRGNATRLVQRLAESGLVRTAPDPADQRLVRVFLTDTGKRRLAAARRRHARANAERFAGLSAEEVRQLDDLTAILVGHLAKNLE
jgi:MarR family 2-MHQ and catechol resistance regulon transcriptional repressor